jgi:hypothetical protein
MPPKNRRAKVFASVAASFSWAICPCRRSAPFSMTPTLKTCHPEAQRGTCLLRSHGIHHSRRQSQERAHRTPRHHEPTPSLYLRALIFSLCALCVKSFEVRLLHHQSQKVRQSLHIAIQRRRQRNKISPRRRRLPRRTLRQTPASPNSHRHHSQHHRERHRRAPLAPKNHADPAAHQRHQHHRHSAASSARHGSGCGRRSLAERLNSERHFGGSSV